MSPTTFTYSDGDGFHFMDQNTFETHTLSADVLGEDSAGCWWTTWNPQRTGHKVLAHHLTPSMTMHWDSSSNTLTRSPETSTSLLVVLISGLSSGNLRVKA